jgi:Zn-dependent protease
MAVIKNKKSIAKALSDFSKRFSRVEVENILIAWLVLSLAFAYVLDNSITSLDFLVVFAAAAIVLGCGFIMHELMHKFTAQKYRYHAEFRLWTWGVVLALVTAFFGFIFAAPGATYFEPDPREPYLDPKGFTKRYGIISLAGPRINIIFGFIFFGLFLVFFSTFNYFPTYIYAFLILVAGLGSYINFYLAAFNMLPINPLDGYKVYHWNKKYWTTVFVIAIAMTIINFIYVLPKI